MFTAKTYDLGVYRLDSTLERVFDYATTKNTLVSSTQFKVDLTKAFGVSVVFKGEGLTFDGNKVPTGGTVTGLEIVSKGKVTYSATITGLDGDDLGAAFAAKSALGIVNAHQHRTSVGSLADKVYGFALDDSLVGNAGNDSLYGNAGNDALWGRQGNDILNAGAGNDTITGGLGSDQMSGGSGSDVFMLRGVLQIGKGTSTDRITDFARGQDKIDFSLIDADWTTPGNGTFTFIGSAAFSGVAGQLRVTTALVSGDVNGDGIADFELRVNGNTPSLADIVL